MTKGVILDRDGTLIDVVRDEETGAVTVAFHPDHVRLLPGVLEGLRALRGAGFELCIATNQPGPAKGQCSAAAVHRTNSALLATLAAHGIRIAALEVCLHHPVGGPGGDAALVMDCDCRKPKPGLLVRAMERVGLDPTESWMIGDTAVDVLAARAAGLRAGLVIPLNRCELCPLRGAPPVSPDRIGASFDELVASIITSSRVA